MNYLKTGMLLAALTAVFMVCGYMLGGESGMVMAFGFALVTNVGAYWFSDSIVLKMYRARQVESGALYEIVAGLAERAQMPMPKVYVIDQDQPNAFATGRNPEHAAVAATTGLMALMSHDELEAVMAHELGHVRNRDSLIMTVTATVAGALGMLAQYAMFFGGRQGQERAHPLAALAMMILAPIAAMLVQMAISRTREYAADKMGAEICGNPLALASALEKLEQGASRRVNQVAEANPATAHLFIINPLHAQRMDNLFSTHPATQNRIRALRELAGSLHSSPPAPEKSYGGPWG